MVSKGQKKGTTKFTVKPGDAAKSVAVAGEFTDWKPVEMKKQKNGSYTVTLPLSPGNHQYKFILDGQWIADPDNDLWAPSPYGTLNSVVQVQ